MTMPARIIPDVYTEVRAVGLATSLPFGLNTVGIVGTSEKGELDTPTLLVSKQQMYDAYGEPGDYRSSTLTEGSEKTLVRAGALAFDGGAPQIYFTRIASDNVDAATRYVTADDGTGSADGYCVGLEALSEGTWGNELKYKVETADGDTTVEGHVAAVGATVENVFLTGASDPGEYEFDTYDGQITPDTTQFTYLQIPSADEFSAVASPSTRIELQRSATDNYQRTLFTVIHTDASYLKSTSEVDTTEVLDTTGEKYSQSFWTIDGYNMTGAVLRLKQSSGTGTVTLKLYAADDNNEPTGSALASSGTLSIATIGAAFGYEELAFSTAYDVLPMTNYCLVLEGTTLTTGSVTWGGGGNGSSVDEYTQGVGKHYTAAWASLTNASDLLFQPTYDIPENWCVFIINDWGIDTNGVIGTKTKKIVWSEISGNAPTPSTDTLYLTYDTSSSIKFTLNYNETSEVYYIVDGYDMIQDINDVDDGSNLVSAAVTTYGTPSVDDFPDRYPLQIDTWQYFGVGAGPSGGTASLGNDGADVGSGDYTTGIATLESVDAHIILAAGQYSPIVHAALQAHCDNMATQKKERTAVAGHRYGQTLSQVMSSNLAFSSKRVIFVSPGITTSNHESGADETVSAAYTAALLAGYMASVNPSFSPLGKGIPVGDLEATYTNAELEQLIKRKINPIRAVSTGGFKWAYAATASLDSSWHEITTVRITDYATIGIRSACESFIGKKNIAQERNSIHSAVSGFMRTMVADQMLADESPFTVSVVATREEQVAGIVRVDVSFKPVFAIKYILITEYVE
jgi:hypothetical protein